MEHTVQCVVVAPTLPNTEQQVDAKHSPPPMSCDTSEEMEDKVIIVSLSC